MYKNDIIKLDRQDDAAAYQTFCSSNLKQCLTNDHQIWPEIKGLFIYLFIIGKLNNCNLNIKTWNICFLIIIILIGEMMDNYLNRSIILIERIRIVITGYFFLKLWQFHIKYLEKKHSSFISIWQNFLADQTFAIFTSLGEFMVLLVKAHHEYYPQIPLLTWFHRSESCEHFFGIARQINSDFDFAELVQMLSKISQYTKALQN